MAAVLEGREADVRFCEDLDISLVQCDQLAGVTVLLARETW